MKSKKASPKNLYNRHNRRELNQTQSELISIVSHQLRTPLSAIKGLLSMILEGFYGPIPKKIGNQIAKAFQNTERLIKLVDDLLDLSRMEQRKMTFEFKKISLTELVKGVFKQMEPQAKDKGLKFIYHPPKKDHLYIRGDANKLCEVIENLIDNAIKYTQKGKIEITLEKLDNQAIISVKDTGIGLDTKEKKYLFEKFIQGKKVPRPWAGGVGLGLYVAKLFVEEHKGQIGAESPGESKGSKFWVRLPLI